MSKDEPTSSAYSQTTFDKDDLLRCARGELFGPGNARLPLPPLLMFDRITEISTDGGSEGKGHVKAELDVHPELWFFEVHFLDNPVMPGAFLLDTLWHLTGFNLAWRGWPGQALALGVGEVKLKSMITPETKKLTYQVNCTRVTDRSKLKMLLSDGIVLADGEEVGSVKGMKVLLNPPPAAA